MDHSTLYALVGLAIVTAGLLVWQAAKIRSLTRAKEDNERQLVDLAARVRTLETRSTQTESDAGTAALIQQYRATMRDLEGRIEVIEDEVSSAWMAWAEFVATGGRVASMGVKKKKAGS